MNVGQLTGALAGALAQNAEEHAAYGPESDGVHEMIDMLTCTGLQAVLYGQGITPKALHELRAREAHQSGTSSEVCALENLSFAVEV